MLTVVCVYWKGKFRGREKSYTAYWVERLREMVACTLDLPHEFVCLSNTTVPCKKLELYNPYHHVGWWSKINLFQPGLFDGRVLYLDLDLVVLRDLKAFVEYDSKFALVPAFGNPGLEKGVVHKFNSSIMAFDANTELTDDLWYTFIQNSEAIMERFRGDQDYIAFQGADRLDRFPKEWTTKLRYLTDKNRKPKDKKVVLCMPGKNEHAAKKYRWVNDIWTKGDSNQWVETNR